MKPVENGGETESRGLVVVGASVHRVCLSRCSSGPGPLINKVQISSIHHDRAKKPSKFYKHELEQVLRVLDKYYRRSALNAREITERSTERPSFKFTCSIDMTI